MHCTTEREIATAARAAPQHAALTTRHECDNLMEDERENKAGTKEIANLLSLSVMGGGLVFLVNNQVQRREGIRDAAAKFGRPCGDGGGGGAAGGAFVLLSRLPSHCLFLRCDALSRWMDAAAGSSLPPLFVLSPSWTSRRSSNASNSQLFQICLLCDHSH